MLRLEEIAPASESRLVLVAVTAQGTGFEDRLAMTESAITGSCRGLDAKKPPGINSAHTSLAPAKLCGHEEGKKLFFSVLLTSSPRAGK